MPSRAIQGFTILFVMMWVLFSASAAGQELYADSHVDIEHETGEVAEYAAGYPVSEDETGAVTEFSVHVSDVESGRAARIKITDAVGSDGAALQQVYKADVWIDKELVSEDYELEFKDGEASFLTESEFNNVGSTHTVRVAINGVESTDTFQVRYPRMAELDVPWLKMLSGLAIVIGIFCVGVWLLKYLNRGAFFRRSRYVQVLDCMPVGKGFQIIVIKVLDRILVLATAGGETQSVAEFHESEFPVEETERSIGAGTGFGKILRNLRREKE